MPESCFSSANGDGLAALHPTTIVLVVLGVRIRRLPRRRLILALLVVALLSLIWHLVVNSRTTV
jgi:hypothetical protein